MPSHAVDAELRECQENCLTSLVDAFALFENMLSFVSHMNIIIGIDVHAAAKRRY